MGLVENYENIISKLSIDVYQLIRDAGNKHVKIIFDNILFSYLPTSVR